MINTFEIQSAKMTIMSDFIQQLLHVGKRLSIQKCEFMDSFTVIDAYPLSMIRL